VIKEPLRRVQQVKQKVNRLLFLHAVEHGKGNSTTSHLCNVLAVDLERIRVSTESQGVLPADPIHTHVVSRTVLLLVSLGYLSSRRSTDVHVTAEDHMGARRVHCRSVPEELERDLRIVYDDEGLPKHCDRANRAVFVFVLEPVVALEHVWGRQVCDISKQWEALGSWW
jgi:hypothetical protein